MSLPGSEPVTAVVPAELGESAALRKIVSAYGRMSSLATERTDLAAVTRLLARVVGSAVAVLSPTLTVLASAGGEDSDAGPVDRLRAHAAQRGLGPVLTTVARARRALTLPGSADPASSAVVAPISTGEDIVAYLVTFSTGDEGFGDDVQVLLTEHAALICGVVLGRERVVAAAAGRARRELIEGVLHGRTREEGEIARWAGHLGFAEGRDHHVLATCARARPPGHDGRSDVAEPLTAAHATIENFLAQHAPDAIVAAREDEVVGIVPAPAGRPGLPHVKELAVRCRAEAERRHPGIVTATGIGGRCLRPHEIAQSYSQARRSLETIRRRTSGGAVVAFAELGVQRLLLQVPDVADLRAFAYEVLGAVLEQDAGGGSEHLRTLSAYFRENCSPRRAATSLHVHPNTVSYRIRRIEELTGLSLNSYQDRLLAQVAVEILVPSGEQ
ncbi:PucR family transcriptional regulator [Pseudonocardia endophytica]|uniref:PucR-like helix-turn-helix protein n=1 Tax=Pseudonocardia endophytica TaxID=401976 RepID=A0A4R1HK71_PSEEN|nr:helix-turn-helix domain-containing protein [Pseudonocardia endophytica]TCK21313.1 PucR-like helix-turn-helix protein [Pseudonocardia endophytica]